MDKWRDLIMISAYPPLDYVSGYLPPFPLEMLIQVLFDIATFHKDISINCN